MFFEKQFSHIAGNPAFDVTKKIFKLNENFYQKTAVATFIDQDRF